MDLKLLIVLLIMAFSFPVWSHKVNVFAVVEDNHVVVEAYFPDGRRVKDSRITVFSDAGEKLHEGVTNAEGVWTFTPAKPQNLTIVLNASMGHRAEYKLSAAEFSGITLTKESRPKASKEPTPWLSILFGLGIIFGGTGIIMMRTKNNEVDN